MGSKAQWKTLISLLEPNFRIIALDLIGYGAAPQVQNPQKFSLKDERERIDLTLQEELPQGEKLHIIGHSYGGATRLSWAYNNPDRIKSLSLYEPVAFHLLEQCTTAKQEIDDVVEHLETLLKLDQEQEACQHFIDYWSHEGSFQSLPPKVQESLIPQIHKVRLDFQALMGENLTFADYQKLGFPITLIMGTQSPLSSRTISLGLRDTIKHIDFHTTESGHMGPITHSDLINKIFQKRFKA